MKIKTICEVTKWTGHFDNQVNTAVAEGWQLVRREVIPGSPNDSARLYAELVLPDPPAEPVGVDPVKALYQVQEFCDALENCEGCPLYAWCVQLRNGGDPTDWELPWPRPEVEV